MTQPGIEPWPLANTLSSRPMSRLTCCWFLLKRVVYFYLFIFFFLKNLLCSFVLLFNFCKFCRCNFAQCLSTSVKLWWSSSVCSFFFFFYNISIVHIKLVPKNSRYAKEEITIQVKQNKYRNKSELKFNQLKKIIVSNFLRSCLLTLRFSRIKFLLENLFI